MGKVIRLAKAHFQGETKSPLTPLMLQTLKKAYEMQLNNVAFGQKDIDGSFNSLLNRGCIKSKEMMVDGIKSVEWYVTESAIRLLNKAE